MEIGNLLNNCKGDGCIWLSVSLVSCYLRLGVVFLNSYTFLRAVPFSIYWEMVTSLTIFRIWLGYF